MSIGGCQILPCRAEPASFPHLFAVVTAIPCQVDVDGVGCPLLPYLMCSEREQCYLQRADYWSAARRPLLAETDPSACRGQVG